MLKFDVFDYDESEDIRSICYSDDDNLGGGELSDYDDFEDNRSACYLDADEEKAENYPQLTVEQIKRRELVTCDICYKSLPRVNLARHKKNRT